MLSVSWVLTLTTSFWTLTSAIGSMDTVYQWKYIDYTWNSRAMRQEAINSGYYNISNILPMDVDKSTIDGRVFMTFQGARGVPATVGVVSNQQSASGPLIRPYPDWSFYAQNSCDSILNVYRVAIDECNRMWMVDNGYLENETPVCSPKLIAFNLLTDSLVAWVAIPNEIANSSAGEYLFTNVIVETEGLDCEFTTVFMSESIGGSIITWDNQRKGLGKFTRLEHPTFKPVPGAEQITSGDYTIRLNGGVVGMSLSPRMSPKSKRFLFYRPLVSFDLCAASTDELRKSPLVNVNYFGKANVLSSQALGQAFNNQGILFLGLTRESGIMCWNIHHKLYQENFELVAQDYERLQYANGVKVVPPCRFNEAEELLVLSNRFTAFQSGRINLTDVNFRILRAPVHKLVHGTKCSPPRNV